MEERELNKHVIVIASLLLEKIPGCRPVSIGGCIRDQLWPEGAIHNKDHDIEVLGASYEQIVDALKGHYGIDLVGKKFGVLKIKGVPIDISLPRTETCIGDGHKDFDVKVDPTLSPEQAAARRDFTINAVGKVWELLPGHPEGFTIWPQRFIDPYHGLADIKAKVLRPTSDKFEEDAIRALRAMQFIARFDVTPTEDCIKRCGAMKDRLAKYPKERYQMEFEKLILRGNKIGKGLDFLWDTGLIDLFPELKALKGVVQTHHHHPEGWLLDVVSSESACASSTLPKSIYSLFLGQFAPCSLTHGTLIPSSGGTLNTEVVNSPTVNCFSLTEDTRTLSSFLSSFLNVTQFTQPKSFVWNLTAANSTQECCRVMFEIPKSCMQSIMLVGTHDFKVAQLIILPVAVYVMDMLGLKELSSNVKLHDQSMKPDSFVIFQNDILISSILIDTSCISVNGNIGIQFEFIFKRDSQFSHMFHLITSHKLCRVQIGDVWEHTKHCMDAFASLRTGNEKDDLIVGYSMLCHDLGKPSTSKLNELTGRITTHGHDQASIPLARAFMERLYDPANDIIKLVCKLVGAHMRPVELFRYAKHLAALRRLSIAVDGRLDLLLRVVECDQKGRPPAIPNMGAIDWINEVIASGNLQLTQKPEMIVKGKHLIDIFKFREGPEIGRILKLAFEAQLDGKFSDFSSGIDYVRRILLQGKG